jgi:5,10-methylenetetrahydromethanopterin reductase
VSMPSIHPTLLAQEALTVGQVSSGRFTLGIGLSHKPVVEGNWGLPWQPPIRYMNEYLDVLLPLLERGSVAAQGSLVSGYWDLEMPVSPVSVILAALGPQMLDIAGKRTGGTTTWMVGPRTLAEHTAPAIRAAAAGAGRPEPLIAAAYPVCVTEDRDDARARAARVYEIYGVFPSYRSMIDREGVAGPEDLAIIGDASFVTDRFLEIEAAGATSIVIDFFGRRAEQEATWELVAELA